MTTKKKLIRIFCSSVMLLTIASTYVATSVMFAKEVQASNYSVIDAQHDLCTVGSDSSESSSSSSSSTTSDSSMYNIDTIKTIYSVLHDQYGVSAKTIAGIIGNWYAESGVIAKRVQGLGTDITDEEAKTYGADTNNGIGLGQWTYERNTMLRSYAESKGKDWWDLETQLMFAVEGDSGAATLKAIASESTGSVSDDAIRYLLEWERPANQSTSVQQTRAGYAESAYELMEANGMTGDKDDSKLSKIGGSSGSSSSVDTTSSSDSTTLTDICATDSDSGTAADGTGSIPSDVGYTYFKADDLPDSLKQYAHSPADVGTVWLENSGQCVDLSNSMGSAIWNRPNTIVQANGEGTAAGWAQLFGTTEKTTPKAGAIFSQTPSSAGNSYGHTGIVSHVFENGDILIVEQNVTGYSGIWGIGQVNTWSWRTVSVEGYSSGWTFAYPDNQEPDWDNDGASE